jgi:hypothetical protein
LPVLVESFLRHAKIFGRFCARNVLLDIGHRQIEMCDRVLWSQDHALLKMVNSFVVSRLPGGLSAEVHFFGCRGLRWKWGRK